MRPAGYFAPSNKACLGRDQRDNNKYWHSLFTIKVFTSAQVDQAAKKIGIDADIAAKLRQELEQ